MAKRTWRQLHDGTMVEVEPSKDRPKHHYVQGPMEPFTSPIDGTRIANRQQLAEHNRRHGVSNDLDSIREQAKRAQRKGEETPQTRHERKLAIKDAIERVESSGYHRKKQYHEDAQLN
jgi:hypothetical protein